MNTSDLKTLDDYLAVLKRRRWYLIVPAAVLGIASLLVALLLPPIYRSSGKILIEQSKIPAKLLASTVTAYASERLQVIEQRVSTSDTLIGIINKYNLYLDDRRDEPMSKLVERMRESSGLELINATKSKNAQGNKQTIAFGVFFDYGQPQIAQRVANELVSLYLSEDIRGRQVRAAETTAFLAAAAQRLDREIDKTEEEFANLTQAYQTALNERRVIAEKLLTAQMGETLETERKDEWFTLIEPPSTPTDPIKPRREIILMLGLLLSAGAGAGAGAGVAAVAIAEAMDAAVHGSMQLASTTGFTPLATIPYIRTRTEIHQRWQRRIGFAFGSAGRADHFSSSSTLLPLACYGRGWNGAWK